MAYTSLKGSLLKGDKVQNFGNLISRLYLMFSIHMDKIKRKGL